MYCYNIFDSIVGQLPIVTPYFAGGYGGNMFVPAIESYDPETNTWTEVSQMQTGKSGQGVTVGPLPDAIT